MGTVMDCSLAVPPAAKAAIPVLVGLGKTWSVMRTRPPSAKTSTDDQSTSSVR